MLINVMLIKQYVLIVHPLYPLISFLSLGPKAFPIDRLMAIFYSIVEGGASSSALILSQISSLVSLNLLVKVSADDQIDCVKYKCVVPLDFMVTIAKQVDFQLLQYLYDT